MLRERAGGCRGGRWAHLLQEVADGVVGHVDGRVGERFDDELLVPREQRAEPK